MKEQLQKDFDNIVKSLSLSQKDIEIKKFFLNWISSLENFEVFTILSKSNFSCSFI